MARRLSIRINLSWSGTHGTRTTDPPRPVADDTMKADACTPTELGFLVEKALALGAVQAKVIPAADVVVENRVPLKCRAGCIGYGKKLTCPPYVPTPDEFRKVLAEYRYALLVKFISPADADPDVICSIYKYWLDPEAPADKKEQATQFWKDHFNGTGAFAPMMLELETDRVQCRQPLCPCLHQRLVPALRDLQREGRHLRSPNAGPDPRACGGRQHGEDRREGRNADPFSGAGAPGTDGAAPDRLKYLPVGYIITTYPGDP